MSSQADPRFLRLVGISKHFGGVRALDDVDFTCERGSIHAILGENGAGKSTLIKVIAGVVQPDRGAASSWRGARSPCPRRRPP